MQVEISSRPAYALAYVRMRRGESIFAEAGAMVSMSAGVQAGASLPGGVVQSALRNLFTQEGFILARYSATADGAWVSVAPRFPGDVQSIDITPTQTMTLQSGSFLAHSDGVDIKAAVGSVQTIALREGATVLNAVGSGLVLVAAYGGIERHDLREREELVVDSGHLVAWSSNMKMQIGPLRGLVSAQLTGEGMVGLFTGPGTVFVQTRAEQQLRSWLFPERAQDKR